MVSCLSGGRSCRRLPRGLLLVIASCFRVLGHWQPGYCEPYPGSEHSAPGDALGMLFLRLRGAHAVGRQHAFHP